MHSKEYLAHTSCNANWELVFVVCIDIVCLTTLLQPATAILVAIATFVTRIRTCETHCGLPGNKCRLQRISGNECNEVAQHRNRSERTEKRSHSRAEYLVWYANGFSAK